MRCNSCGQSVGLMNLKNGVCKQYIDARTPLADKIYTFVIDNNALGGMGVRLKNKG